MPLETLHLLPYGSQQQKSLNPEDARAQGVQPYGPTVALAMALNYIIGTGCFGLPYAFHTAGILLCSILLLIGLFGAIITMNYTLESLARAEGVFAATHGRGPLHRITYRKFDFTLVGEIFAGEFGKYTAQLVITLYGIGSLWSYASIFASSLASIIMTQIMEIPCDVYGPNPSNSCLDAYYTIMAFFAVIVISMVILNLSEQANVQKILCFYRVLAFSLMLATILVKLCADGADVLWIRYKKIGGYNWQHFGKGFGPTLLALNCHYNMPDVLQPLYPKMFARDTAFSALLISGTFYLLLGVLGALTFDQVNPLVSLMWSNYTGCGNGWAPCDPTHVSQLALKMLGVLAKFIILLFPVVNVTSTYPMVGLTIGDNLLSCIPKSLAAPLGPKVARNVSRLLVSIPPLILAMVFKQLDFIFSIAGILGFLLGLTIPCWFQVIGSQYCQRVWGFTGASITPYNVKFISSIKFAQIYLGITFVVTAIAVWTLYI
ncbi:unnamed protein product [Albugo candida]|uniref:Amino acid transporter transmembrane domain-containing protein n=1 Tax=Albugo candida TaxID=65357 RepID=A0A024G351_9STRA|nr:unnamed protein product [Albugo candida]|eukprot:CCI41091.1 unnamed protein product [Albugo candida]